MFDISEKLIVEQSDEIFGVSQISWEDSPWKQFFWSTMKESSVTRMQSFMYSQILCYVLERWIRTQHQILLGNSSWVGSKIDHNAELWTQLTGNRWNSSGIFFPGFTTLQLVQEVQKFINKMGEPEQFQGRIIFMSMFNDIIWWIKDNEKECIANSTLVSLLAKRFPAGHWSFLRPGSETKWYSTYNERPQGEWDKVAELMMVKFGESGHPVFRATSPLSRGTLKSKGGGKLSIHFCADGDTIETVFRTIISVNQLSIYGAVSDVCEEYSTCQVRTVRHVLAGQCDPSFEPASLYWQSNLTHCSRQQIYL